MDGRYNTRSPAVKRLMKEAQELSEPTDQYFAQPLDDNLFEWHFTIRGPAESDFQNGIYHGRIILPVDYPMKPPSIIWLTPNGRFETNKKICLSISGHHPESWQPSWSIRTALLAIIGFMPTHSGGAIGALDYTPDERKVLAKKTKDWKCPSCGDVTGILLETSENSDKTSKESKELAAQINLQGEKPKCKQGGCPVEQARIEEIQAQQSAATTVSPASPQASGEQKEVSDTATPVDSNSSNTVLTDTAPAPLMTATPLLAQQQTSHALPWLPGAAINAFPMAPPTGFPYHFPAAAALPPPPIMHFPYPPSHYSSSPQQPGWPLPFTGMGGMFPPPPPPSLFCALVSNHHQVSTNNSSTHEETSVPAEVSSDSNKPAQSLPNNNQPTSGSPMASPKPASTSHHLHKQQQPCPASTSPGNQPDTGPVNVYKATAASCSSYEPEDVLKELLSKVKRVGSDPESPAQEASQDVTKADVPADPITTDPVLDSPQGPGVMVTGENSPPSKIVFLEGDTNSTNSELSKSLNMNMTDKSISISEMGDMNTDNDNSESGVPPIEGSETDQRSHLEMSTCSSTSCLDRKKQKLHPSNKSLRQRHSVPVSLPSEVSEEGASAATEPDRSDAAGPRQQQRIEAASGDTSQANGLRQRGGRGGNNRNAASAALQNNQGSLLQRDASFYIMVCLLTGSLLILLNRLISLENWI